MNKLKLLRKQRDKTQKEIGDVIGVSFSYYAKIERGESELTENNIILLARYYNVTADYLLGLSEENYSEENELRALNNIRQEAEFLIRLRHNKKL